MSLYFVEGDMFAREVDIRINTVNCVGVMGKGVALAFKQRYPNMFSNYREACRLGKVKPGKLHVYKVGSLTIINFPTKRNWRENSRYEDIESGLTALRDYLEPLGNISVTLPALGCGLGGLDWKKVKDMIIEKLSGLSAEIWVYSPSDSRKIG